MQPSLLMAVYDPVLSMQEAFEAGFTRMQVVNANGIVAINIGLQIRDIPGYPMSYDYELSISSLPATTIVCNSDSVLSYPCFISLFIQIPTFERITVARKQEMSWSVSLFHNSMKEIIYSHTLAGCGCFSRLLSLLRAIIELDTFSPGFWTVIVLISLGNSFIIFLLLTMRYMSLVRLPPIGHYGV